MGKRIILRRFIPLVAGMITARKLRRAQKLTFGETLDPRVIARNELSRKHYPNEAQMGTEQIDYILDVLPPSGNLLVWGLGNDSPYWHNSTAGKVIFLEDDFPLKKDGILLYDHILNNFPYLMTYQVHYSTRNNEEDFRKYMAGPWTPQLEIDNFPPEVLETAWDVILVDAPLGCCNMGPARFQSLYMSMKLVQKQLKSRHSDEVHVFVDDFERKIERNFSQKVFRKAPERVTKRGAGVSNANEQAHFVFKRNDCIVNATCFLGPKKDLPLNNQWVVLLTVNDGYFDFFLNWLAFYKQLADIQQVPVTIVAEDDVVFEKLQQEPRIPAHFVLERSHLELKETPKNKTVNDIKAQDYESPNYMKMVSTRATLILQKLDTQTNVLYSDVDTVWLSDPLSYITANKSKEGKRL